VATIPQRTLTLRAFSETGEGREWTVPQRFTIDTEQTRRKRPNKGTIKIWNLGGGAIGFLEAAAELVEIVADGVGLLYRGDPRTVRTAIDGPDVVTTITCGDGGRAYRTAKLSRSYAPGTTSSTVLADLAAAAGYGLDVLGTLSEITYESGHVVAGRVTDAIDELVESAGASWSIQDGQLQILADGAPSTEGSGAVLLAAGTGLIASPERRDKGIACKALLRPQLRPGRLFKVESRLISGWYRVSSIKHKAGSRGDPWESEIEARKP
jgi:hypothetical protein